MPFQTTDERLDRLEALTGQIIVAHEAAIRRLERLEHAVELMQQEGERERDEAQRERAEAQRGRDEAQRERDEAQRERDEAQRERDEAKQERVLQNKRWGEITMKMGTFVEDIVAPNIPRIAREDFGLGEAEMSGLRLKVRFSSDPSRSRELDYVYAAPEGWVVNETKSSVRAKDVDEFSAALGEVYECFPQYRGRPLYPILSSLYLTEEVVKYCTRRGIYALALGDETMVLLNKAEVVAQKSTAR